ncbi:MAG: bifunctional ornithine acetyltransferase/N-acetylglutamate synthase, partial [Fuerstia sp.]|nr:bifunctional ornithine acetyltransferase/N-acetylglutamate synthase [Fuerstiella sp.]
MNAPSISLLPAGFQASGSTCGIKVSGKPDLALFVSDRGATAAGVFTTNKVCGAPVIVSKQRVPSTVARAVIINSGNSNAATGEPGIQDAMQMTSALAEQLGCDAKSVFVCSTGVIGVPLPMPTILNGIPHGIKSLGTSD